MSRRILDCEVGLFHRRRPERWGGLQGKLQRPVPPKSKEPGGSGRGVPWTRKEGTPGAVGRGDEGRLDLVTRRTWGR